MVFNNVYEMLTPPAVIKKSWLVEYFDGSALNNRWVLTTNVGTATETMVDTVDEGHEVKSGTITNDDANLDLGDIHHYDFNGCVCIWIYRRVAPGEADVGFYNTSAMAQSTGAQIALMQDRSSNTFKKLLTGGTSFGAGVDTSIAVDTSFHRIKIDILASNVNGYLNGILEATSTASQPTIKMQPCRRNVRRVSGQPGQSNCRYAEAYNT